MRHFLHLMKRFLGSVASSRPGPTVQATVGSLLGAHEAEVFWAQPVMDQDHAVRGMVHIGQQHPGRIDLQRAFLLHDVGKRHSRLGAVGRSVATILGMAHLPRTARHAAYLSHAESGAAELETLGCEPLVVSFARHHHGTVPVGTDPGDWAILVAADHL